MAIYENTGSERDCNHLTSIGRKRKEEIRSMEESNTEQGDTLLK